MSEPLSSTQYQVKELRAVLPIQELYRYYRMNQAGGVDCCDTFLKLLALEVGVNDIEAQQALTIMDHLSGLHTAVVRAEGAVNKSNGDSTEAAEEAAEARRRLAEAQEALKGFVFKFQRL